MELKLHMERVREVVTQIDLRSCDGTYTSYVPAHRPHPIQFVNPSDFQDPSALGFARPPTLKVIGSGIVVENSRDRQRRTQGSSQFDHPSPRRTQPPLVSHHETDPGSLAGTNHLPAIRDFRSHCLFTINVFTCMSSGESYWPVSVVRAGDSDSLDINFGE